MANYYLKRQEYAGYDPVSEATINSILLLSFSGWDLNYGADSCGSCPEPETQTRSYFVVWAANDYTCCIGSVRGRRFECSMEAYAKSRANYVPNSWKIVDPSLGYDTLSPYEWTDYCRHSYKQVNTQNWAKKSVEWYEYDS